MLIGIISGATIGLFFHHDDWLGGYSTFRRRMIRLAHISFFGLGFLNIFFGITLKMVSLNTLLIEVASWAFIGGAITMPLCCFLCAWKKKLWILFPIPVMSLLLGTVLILWSWQ
jgi:hypothetical protein